MVSETAIQCTARPTGLDSFLILFTSIVSLKKKDSRKASDYINSIALDSASGRLGVCLVSRRGIFSERFCAAFAPPGTIQSEQAAVGGRNEVVEEAFWGMASR